MPEATPAVPIRDSRGADSQYLAVLMRANTHLDKEICAEHPRAVLHKDVKLTLREDNSIERRSGDENRMQCLFRHLRNGIAHGQTYLFPTGLVLIEDRDGKRITARILIRKETLLAWIYIVEKKEV